MSISTEASERLLSVAEVGERIGVATQLVRDWCQSGKLRAADLNPEGAYRLWRVHPADLEAFLGDRTRAIASPRAPRHQRPRVDAVEVGRLLRRAN